MMSANEFFDCGPEPPWLVDACDGEIVSPNSDLEFFDLASSSSAPYLGLDHDAEAGPSNSAMHMELDEANSPNDPSFFAHNPRQEFERSLQNVSLGILSGRPPALPTTSEQRRPWLSTTTPNVPNRAPTRRFAPAPAADLFRACKKRKRSYA